MLKWPVVSRVWLPTWLDDPGAVIDRIETELAEAGIGVPGGRVPPAVGVSATETSTIAASPPAWTGFQTSSPAAAPVHPPLSDFEKAVLDDHPVTVDEVPRTMRNDLIHQDDAERPFRAWRPPDLAPWLLAEPTSANLDRVRAVMAAGVDLEGPVHVERLVRLVAELFGIRRLTAEKQRMLMTALPRDRMATENGTVLWPAGVDPESYLQYRPSGPSERALAHVPAVEIGNAMVPTVRRSMGIDREELLRTAMRVFGSERLTVQVRERMEAGLDSAINRGLLIAENDRVVAA
jgi:hypothetical protein